MEVIMTDNLYEHFYDPTNNFKEEPRAFCYDLSQKLISKAKIQNPNNWYTREKTINAILLLLFCWNFASPITKKLKKQDINDLLRKTNKDLKALENKTILNFDKYDEKIIKDIYKEFKSVVGQTGASKALSLINPKLFVMWDTRIRGRLKKFLIKGIDNGKKPEHYLKFLKGINLIIKRYKLEDKVNQSSPIAKKIDEYNYVEIIMKS